MHLKRVIPCLDVTGGRVVKGVGFVDLRDAGDPVELAARYDASGAGEMLLTSMDRDGTSAGYDLSLTRAVAERVAVPVIASGGAGELQHLAEALDAGADAVLLASILHYGHHTVEEIKSYLAAAGLPVRITAPDRASPGSALTT